MALFDRAQLLVVRLPKRRIEQLFQVIGNARDGGVDDQHPRAAGAPLGGDLGDVAPVGE